MNMATTFWETGVALTYEGEKETKKIIPLKWAVLVNFYTTGWQNTKTHRDEHHQQITDQVSKHFFSFLTHSIPIHARNIPILNRMVVVFGLYTSHVYSGCRALFHTCKRNIAEPVLNQKRTTFRLKPEYSMHVTAVTSVIYHQNAGFATWLNDVAWCELFSQASQILDTVLIPVSKK